ncbi:signal peptidase I [Streptomyces sp. NP160]|uniref:signal peptidase I n=1 Tax=Streptomyces sp. NP160 TaxID=2586637 RepID=UPI00111A8F51|nr:signal peptidase I [Streptomyces sp. NP160]TNM69717.1 signal peptidase I [Streptomyces sp. NP160]
MSVMSLATRWSRRLGVTVVALGVVLAAAAQLHGWRAVPVLSGSMTPYAAQGSLVLTVPVAPSQVRVGDVVAFAPPEPYARGHHPVMHRVVSLEQRAGTTAMTTRGDVNPEADPWTVDLNSADLGRAVLVAPGAGWLFMAGPGAAMALLLGAAAVAEGVSAMRPSGCSCPSPVAQAAEVDAVVEVTATAQPQGPASVFDITDPASPPVGFPAPRRPAPSESAAAHGPRTR